MPSLKAYGLALLLLAAFPSCRTQAGEGKAEAVSRLLDQSAAEISRQQYEPALEKALEALETAGEEPLLRVRSLLRIVGVDIMASRDADAWEKALEAEQTARREGFGKELSEALIAKAKLCSYAEISPETARNDEGLAYAGEANRHRVSSPGQRRSFSSAMLCSLWKSPMVRTPRSRAPAPISRAKSAVRPPWEATRTFGRPVSTRRSMSTRSSGVKAARLAGLCSTATTTSKTASIAWNRA